MWCRLDGQTIIKQKDSIFNSEDCEIFNIDISIFSEDIQSQYLNNMLKEFHSWMVDWLITKIVTGEIHVKRIFKKSIKTKLINFVITNNYLITK